ncbi:MAG TPA: ferritin-like domain-containing protein [Polyangiaceae bacterium]|nr:ferritin-like domain-containing protein [Polyangiaceae bacterium]
MKLRTRLDVFSTALLSALGATQLMACGGTAIVTGAGSGGSGSISGESTGGESMAAGSGQGGASAAGGSGQGGAGIGGTPSTGGAGPVSNPYPCKNPKALGNGVIQCESGFVHRQSVQTCTSQVPRPDPVANPAMVGECKVDADCKEKPYGWCTTSFGDVIGTYCNYGCINDSDCGDNRLCECAEPVGRCVQQAGCLSDADCESGFLCKAYDQSGGCGMTAYTCQTASDTCGSDADCARPTSTEYCQFDTMKHSFQCLPLGCVIGRPFLVEGEQRLARSAARADWSELLLLPDVAEIDSALRARLAEDWTRIGLMEHASIAAFARFTLQLMSLGAPASLIERATAAMADETKHAKACFAVAGRYAGSPLGPARLAVERSLDESSLEEIVLNAIREGCVGETVAAIEAREAAEHAQDPAVRALLLEVSEDETRHAELAYRFVEWALAQGGPALERAVEREFAALAAETPRAYRALDDSERILLRQGIVPDALRQAIRGQAVAEVILPCARLLTAARRQRRIPAQVELG